MAALTNAQIEQKKQQLKQLADKAQQLKNELVEAGAWPLNENDLDNVAGGASSLNPSQRPHPVDPKRPKLQPYDGPEKPIIPDFLKELIG
jgi:hypothetical protein